MELVSYHRSDFPKFEIDGRFLDNLSTRNLLKKETANNSELPN
jgi:hypothetical protein